MLQDACDCYRGDPPWSQTDKSNEIRFFHDEARNISLMFFLWFGQSNLPGGTTPIGEFLANGPKCPVGWTRSRVWEVTPDRLVKEIIAPLQPTHLVMSCGIWKDTRSPVYWEALRLAGESLNARTQCIWRTSGVHGPRYTPFFQRLEAACQKIRRGAFNLAK